MAEGSNFHPFDKDAPTKISERYLPHWFQPGAATFVTFRTYDSMPQCAIELWQERLKLFLRSYKLCEELVGSRALAQMPPMIQRTFDNYRSSVFHKLLDKGYGECLLRHPRYSAVVAETLQYYDGQQYELERFVVMPNHVHMLAAFRKEYDMRRSLENCLHYSAMRINELRGEEGPFWQAEPFDHCIRNAEQFCWIQKYIKQNPKKARLRPGNFYYWERSNGMSQQS